jgi:hypothetical protein
MSDAMDTGLLPRTYFRAPRVPFDFRALALAILGFLAYWAGGLLLSKVFGPSLPDGGEPDVPGAFLTAAYSIFRDVPYVGEIIGALLASVFQADIGRIRVADYGFWRVLVGGVWFFGVWSFFGQGIHRITALRIARDEGLSIAEALKFSAKNWLTMLLAPVIIMGAIGFFYLCNMLAGLVISIPFVGGLLALLLVPLAVISTLLILLIAVGGVFGLPLVGAAAAWERNGSLDAISRAFSYIYARPLQFFWNYFLVFMLLGVILLVGSWFLVTLTKSVEAGVLGDRLSVLIDPVDGTNRGPESEFSGLSEDARKDWDALQEKTGLRGRDATGTPWTKDFQAVLVAPWSHKINAFVFWVAINLIWLGVYGYAIYWFLGASTSVYADLRADVDGTEEDEIYLEGEEDQFDALDDATATPPAPRADGGSAGGTEGPAGDAGTPS